jgi:hypothetical protein
MPVNPKKPLFVFGTYSATVFWLHAHQTMPLNSSDILKSKIAVCDWTPTQQLLDKSCLKGEDFKLNNACKCQKTVVCN